MDRAGKSTTFVCKYCQRSERSAEFLHFHQLCRHPTQYSLSRECFAFYEEHQNYKARVLNPRICKDSKGAWWLKNENDKFRHPLIFDKNGDAQVAPLKLTFEDLTRPEMGFGTQRPNFGSLVPDMDEEKKLLPADLWLGQINKVLDVEALRAKLHADLSMEDNEAGPSTSATSTTTAPSNSESHLPLKKRPSASSSLVLLRDQLIADVRQRALDQSSEDARQKASDQPSVDRKLLAKKREGKREGIGLPKPIRKPEKPITEKYEKIRRALLRTSGKPVQYEKHDVRCVIRAYFDVAKPGLWCTPVEIYKRRSSQIMMSASELNDLMALLNQKRTKAIRQIADKNKPEAGWLDDKPDRFKKRKLVQTYAARFGGKSPSRKEDLSENSRKKRTESAYYERRGKRRIEESDFYDKKMSKEQVVESEFCKHMRLNLRWLMQTESQSGDKSDSLSKILGKGSATQPPPSLIATKNAFSQLALHNSACRKQFTERELRKNKVLGRNQISKLFDCRIRGMAASDSDEEEMEQTDLYKSTSSDGRNVRNSTKMYAADEGEQSDSEEFYLDERLNDSDADVRSLIGERTLTQLVIDESADSGSTPPVSETPPDANDVLVIPEDAAETIGVDIESRKRKFVSIPSTDEFACQPKKRKSAGQESSDNNMTSSDTQSEAHHSPVDDGSNDDILKRAISESMIGPDSEDITDGDDGIEIHTLAMGQNTVGLIPLPPPMLQPVVTNHSIQPTPATFSDQDRQFMQESAVRSTVHLSSSAQSLVLLPHPPLPPDPPLPPVGSFGQPQHSYRNQARHTVPSYNYYSQYANGGNCYNRPVRPGYRPPYPLYSTATPLIPPRSYQQVYNLPPPARPTGNAFPHGSFTPFTLSQPSPTRPSCRFSPRPRDW